MGKRLIILGAGLGAAAGVAGALYYKLFRRSLAQTKGLIKLCGLTHDVEIIRDDWGIPHVYAENPHDLFFAQGFVHAQDRLFQMDFWRRLGAGRLAEVLGPPAIETDRWMRVLGLRRAGEKEVALLDDETRELTWAYASGVNAFLDQKVLPLEFRLLRYKPERWQIADSLTWLKFMDWSLSVNWETELLRAQLIAQLGPERAAQLTGVYPGDHPTVLPKGMDWRHIGQGALARADAARPYIGPPTETGLGSNNWVVDGSHTASGAPLLANDMHLALTAPSIWYENHLCGGDYDVAGLSFAGLPGIIAGHNGRVAWGYTAGFPDTQDLYVERLNPKNPHQYEFEGAWHDAEVLREEIVVKGAEPVREEVVITRHGPLIDGLVPDEAGEPLALRWTAHDPGQTISLIFDIARVGNCHAFHQCLRRWTGPSQNVVYADVEGNVGYTLVGRLPVRVQGHDGTAPVPGWTGEYEWRGYVPFEEQPHVINPPGGKIITANTKPVPDDYPYFLGHAWLPGFRAGRIAELLDDASELTVADFCHMQFDFKSVLAHQVGQRLSCLSPSPKYRIPDTVLSLFQNWDGDLAPDSPTAAVYQVFIRRLSYNLFDKTTAGTPVTPDLADRFVGKGPNPFLAATSLYGSKGRMLLSHLLKEGSAGSPVLERQFLDDLMAQSLREAVEFLEWELGPQVDRWRWGDLHQLTYAHPLGQVKLLEKLFNHGPYPIGGDDTTVWATGAYYHSLEGGQMVGPVCRFVVDLGDLRRSCSLNAPGQSGQPGSPHYADRIQAWFQGDYHPMLYRREDVVAQARDVLHLAA